MQQYIIKSFKRTSDDAIFVRPETGTNSGGYSFGTEHKRLNDFLCDSNFIIWSVLRCENTTRNGEPTGTIFTIGDRLTNPINGVAVGQLAHITSIKIMMSDVILQCGTGLHQTIRLINANKYIAPQRNMATTTRAVSNRTATQRTPTPIEQIEEAIIRKNPREIRIIGLLKKRKETLRDFLVKFFKEWNEDKDTIYSDDKSVQTEAGRRRSLGDIYMICKYYYPNCTLNEVLNLLYNVLPTVITEGFRSSYCNTINKRVWYYDSEDVNAVYNKTNNDEFGKPYKFYIDNITN